VAAQALALDLGLPVVQHAKAGSDTVLLLTAAGLQLQAQGVGPIMVDFGAGKLRHRRRGGHNEPLGKAVGIGKRQNLRLVDATAGLGRDGFVLADLGCEVTYLERSAIAFALLRDGIARAQLAEDAWLQEVSARLRLYRVESVDWLASSEEKFDVVYLDPMFPASKKSARAKKEMWLFQQIIGPGNRDQALLEQALDTASWRVVVKRPAKAPSLEGPRPHHAIGGKTVRFDVYMCA
jgi:16S rRNA (guanine1516-N2)-methyltransferase